MSSKVSSGVHACDQCRARRSRCDRKSPVCSSCEDRQLACTINRSFIYKPSVSYQNVSTFTLAKPRTKSASKKATTKTQPAPTTNSHEVFTLLKIQPTELAMSQKSAIGCDLKRWFDNSYSRFILNYYIKLSGIPLANTTNRDMRFLTEILVLQLKAMSMQRKMILQIEITQIIDPLLNEATDAYFHYFNPFHLLFTRHGFDSHPRSELLRLSVWRTGLQFLLTTPLNKTVADRIDTRLLELTEGSKVEIRFDVFQSYLILFLGIISSPILKRTALFRNTIIAMMYALGVHVPTPGNSNVVLERTLAYRLAVSRDIRYVFTMDTITHFTDEYNPFHTISNNISQRYAMKIAIKIDRATQEFHLNQIHLKGAISASLDYCSLVASESLYECSIILQRVYFSHLNAINHLTPVKELQTTIQGADNSLYRTFKKSIGQLLHLRALTKSRELNSLNTLPVSWESNNCHKNGMSSRASLIYKQVLKVFDQMILFLSTQLLFCRLHIMSIGAHIDPNKLQLSVSPRPNIHLVTPFISAGIQSATLLLKLLDRIGTAPFCYIKSAPLSKAYIFIALHYHTYSHGQLLKSSKSRDTLSNPFDNSLCLARKLLYSLLPCPISGFFARNSIVYFDAFLTFQKIMLPPSLTYQES